MAKLTIVFGILLILLGILGFVYTGSAHPTALIPAVIGLFFIFFGVMANTEDPKKRMLWMHISVTVALLVFLGTIPADINTIRIARGDALPHPVCHPRKGSHVAPLPPLRSRSASVLLSLRADPPRLDASIKELVIKLSGSLKRLPMDKPSRCSAGCEITSYHPRLNGLPAL